MKIAEITNVDFSLRHFLLPLMRGARARGHEVVGLCAEGPLLDLPRSEGFRVIPVPMARSLNPLTQARCLAALREVFARERFDLVHAHMPISGLLARAAAKSVGVPHIAYTCHGFLFNQPGPWWRRKLSFGLEWVAGRITDTYLTVSAEEAGDAIRLGIHPRATAVLNGRDPAVFRPDAAARAAVRAELGAAAAECVIVAVSRLVRHKGYPELLAAMEQVPDATLWVVGERLASDHGEDLDPAFARAEAVLGRRFRRLGYRHDVARVLAAADVFTLPSHFEGLPMSVIEGMLCGLPVVATDIRGPREMVVEDETGFLVPPMTVAPLAAALQRLASDAALRARMGAAGRARAVERFDEAKVVGRTLDLLGL
ncbi:glycosyltransferase family 4 protein [Siccirubricoccus sp. KC 17139]|uniref:Glycosyltransferase family 4 protein n=1 Tax=Siccirubricoccus soli TaxID=2899147 RepID=A0ABT1D407_9PROT|nr:glycosyltransferase family 4 protein [Siccirubricoccus soli]MCO6416663.1 glycosyltransferase family 4 protein [Siccirubricoccus soli]MCP2682798.1 glycosyltransferase family 4 protein [Siccirubricoccus soli]